MSGIYDVRAENGVDYPAAVDLLDPAASDLRPRKVTALDRAGASLAPIGIPLAKRAKTDLWPAIAAIVLAVLLLEWILYHRRIS